MNVIEAEPVKMPVVTEQKWPLAVITLLAMVLRFWQIGFGLPNVIFGDEGLYVYFGLNMGGGDLNPHFYPAFYFYLCFFVDVGYILAGVATGQFAQISQAWDLYLSDPSIFYVLARGISAALGVLTIPLTYWAVRKVFANRSIALLSALFLAFSFIHFQYSQIAMLDATLTFLLMLAFYCGLRALESGRLGDLMIAGGVSGLAFSTKYNAIPAVVWGLICSFQAKEKGNILKSLSVKRIFIFLAGMTLGYTAGTPFWILTPREFFGEFIERWVHANPQGGQLGFDGKWNWLHYLFIVFPHGVGWPLALAGIAGLGSLFFKRDPRYFMVTCFPLLYFALAGWSPIRAARYGLPMVPFLCIGAAYAVTCLNESIQTWKGPGRWRLQPWALPALILTLMFPSALKISRYLYLKTAPDTRQQALAWLRENITSRQKILQTFGGISFVPSEEAFQFTDLDPTVFDLRVKEVSSLKDLSEYREQGYQYLLLDDWHLGLVTHLNNEKENYKDVRERYMHFLSSLSRDAVVIAEFSPYKDRRAEFDTENVEFPFRSLWNLKSMGPPIKIYKLKPATPSP